jgi:hypothetical protein
MSEVRLVLRDAEREISGTIHGSMADRAVAALAAEPRTIDELDTALARFHRPDGSSFFGWFAAQSSDEPYDAGLVIIDLAARLVAYESTYSSPARDGCVEYHDGKCATDIGVHYYLSDDWHFTTDLHGWRHTAEQRRRERAAQPPLDARAVLYGRPLLEFIAAECFGALRTGLSRRLQPIPPESRRRTTRITPRCEIFMPAGLPRRETTCAARPRETGSWPSGNSLTWICNTASSSGRTWARARAALSSIRTPFFSPVLARMKS